MRKLTLALVGVALLAGALIFFYLNLVSKPECRRLAIASCGVDDEHCSTAALLEVLTGNLTNDDCAYAVELVHQKLGRIPPSKGWAAGYYVIVNMLGRKRDAYWQHTEALPLAYRALRHMHEIPRSVHGRPLLQPLSVIEVKPDELVLDGKLVARMSNWQVPDEERSSGGFLIDPLIEQLEKLPDSKIAYWHEVPVVPEFMWRAHAVLGEYFGPNSLTLATTLCTTDQPVLIAAEMNTPSSVLMLVQFTVGVAQLDSLAILTRSERGEPQETRIALSRPGNIEGADPLATPPVTLYMRSDRTYRLELSYKNERHELPATGDGQFNHANLPQLLTRLDDSSFCILILTAGDVELQDMMTAFDAFKNATKDWKSPPEIAVAFGLAFD